MKHVQYTVRRVDSRDFGLDTTHSGSRRQHQLTATILRIAKLSEVNTSHSIKHGKHGWPPGASERTRSGPTLISRNDYPHSARARRRNNTHRRATQLHSVCPSIHHPPCPLPVSRFARYGGLLTKVTCFLRSSLTHARMRITPAPRPPLRSGWPS